MPESTSFLLKLSFIYNFTHSEAKAVRIWMSVFLNFRYCPSRFPLMLPMQTMLEDVWCEPACTRHEQWSRKASDGCLLVVSSSLWCCTNWWKPWRERGKLEQTRCFDLVIHRLLGINVLNPRWKAETLLKVVFLVLGFVEMFFQKSGIAASQVFCNSV